MQTSRTTRRLALTTLAGMGLQAAAPALHAQRPVQLRVGSLVPKNSLYHQSLMELGETWRAAQGGSARFTVFTDGSQGGEAEMARRMRIGQLQGALMSVVGLREIEHHGGRHAEPAAALPQLGRGRTRAREDARHAGSAFCREGFRGAGLG